MNAMERMQAVLSGRQPDRPPFSAWGHVMNLYDRDQRAFARETIAFQEANGFDFVKVMSNPFYMLEDMGIALLLPADNDTPVARDPKRLLAPRPEDWARLTFPRAGKGALLREREAIREVAEHFQGDVPVIATIFTPIMWVAYAALPREEIDAEELRCGSYTALLERYLTENEKYLRPALRAFSELNQQYMEELLQAGVSGFFYCSEHIRDTWSGGDAFDSFEKQYDLAALQAIHGKSLFNILHICGGRDLRMDRALDYPVEALNWDSLSPHSPSLGDVRALTDKVLVGGLDHRRDMLCEDPAELADVLRRRISRARAQAGDRLVLSGGCDWRPESVRHFPVWRKVMAELA